MGCGWQGSAGTMRRIIRLSLMARPGSQLQLRFDHRPDLFDGGTVEGFAGRLVRLLAGAVAHPEWAIGRLELLGARSARASCGGGTRPGGR